MMLRILGAVILVAASVWSTLSLAAMSAVNPALLQNIDARPKKVVLLPPQVFVFELSGRCAHAHGRLGDGCARQSCRCRDQAGERILSVRSGTRAAHGGPVT